MLGTGVDVPEVDLVVMASPRQSHVDVLQMAGRATRLAPGKPCGYVLCPARSTVVDGEEVLDEGAFTTALNVLRVFVSLDEQLQQRLAGALREAVQEASERRAMAGGGKEVKRGGMATTGNSAASGSADSVGAVSDADVQRLCAAAHAAVAVVPTGVVVAPLREFGKDQLREQVHRRTSG